jgi:hypothetical protein
VGVAGCFITSQGMLEPSKQCRNSRHYVRFEVIASYIVTNVSEVPAASIFSMEQSAQVHRPGCSFLISVSLFQKLDLILIP